jgi:hypothetical protein
LVFLASACSGDEPGLGSGSSSGSESDGSGTESESSDTLDPDSTGTTGEDGWAEICDGSEGLRLAMVLGGGGLVANEIEREIGFRYLYVLGTCEYFVLPNDDAGAPWPDARTGVMDVATEEQLSRALDYGHLADIAGAWDTEGLSDGSTLSVSDGTLTVACYGGCESGPAGAQALWAEMGWIDALWAEGQAYEGPLRVSVIGWVDATLDELPAAWPLPIDPWSIARNGDTDPAPEAGETVLIDDASQAATLRELRRQYRDDDLPDDVPNALTAYGHLTFGDAGGQDLFQLWMRDSLPVEDDAGLIALPQP